MKWMKKLFLMVWILLFSIFLMSSPPETSALEYGQKAKEMDHFFQAKKNVFQRYWQRACRQLDQYLKDYPSGQMRDEALYWLALSLNKSTARIDKISRVIEVKQRSIEWLNDLIRHHPKSLWLDDARALRIEIATQLVILGKEGYKKIIDDVIKKENKTETELKLMALNSLINLEPAAAIPTLASLLKKEKDPMLRKNVVLLLGKNYSQPVVDILEAALKREKDPGVKKELIYWLGRIKIRLLPVQLNYFVLSATLTKPARAPQIKDNTLNRFSIDLGDRFSKRAFQKRIDSLFKQKFHWSLTQASSRDVSPEGVTTAHNTRYVYIRVLKNTIKKQSDSIMGKVLFRLRKNKKTFFGDFSVRDQKDQIFIYRHQDHLSILILHFQKKEGNGDHGSSTEDRELIDMIQQLRKISAQLGLKKEPVYYTRYANVMGCIVHTTLQNTGSVRQEGKMDFSEAKAEIPTSEGRWILKGHLLLLMKERTFLARKGILINPSGGVQAAGLEIKVPIDAPGRFKIKGEIAIKPTGQKGKIIYRGQFDVTSDLTIYSTRENYRLKEFSADKIYFQQAKAEIKVGKHIWILTGILTLDKSTKQIVAQKASLVIPGKGEPVTADTIIIPVQQPQNYQIKKQ